MELKRSLLSAGDRSIALLIVPYGIETTDAEFLFLRNLSFNRTLWN